MKLVVGLGNPGGQYALTRHNAGFMAVAALQKSLGFAAFSKKFEGAVCKGRVSGHDLILLLPQTFMNLSGKSVQAAMAFYKLSPADILVIHDDIDLDLGTLRFKVGGGDAGHNGLKSITASIGPAYGRLRLGVGRPEHKSQVSDYVLSPFLSDELLTLSERLDWINTHIDGLLSDPIATVRRV